MNIAIIGCGISGIYILKTIIDHPNYYNNINLHIFEPRKELGVGLAYENDTKYKLLNVDESYMSLDLHNPDHINNWILNNDKYSCKIESMLPRKVYGKYIKDTFDTYLDRKNIHIHHEEVIDLNEINNKYKIKTNIRDYEESFDTIFLSIGQSHYKDDYKLKSKDKFIYNPYPLKENLVIDRINMDTSIGIIGAGPTSIDIYRFIKRKYKLNKPIYFFTKSSSFPVVEIPYKYERKICSIDDSWIDEHINDKGFIDLYTIKNTFNNDFKRYGYDFNKVYERYKDTDIKKYKLALEENDRSLAFTQNYLMEFWYVAAKLYNSLSGLDKAYADDNYVHKIDFLITKTPTATMKDLISNYDKQSIKIIKETNEIIVTDKDNFIVKRKNNKDIEIDLLINAQGFEKELVKAIKKYTLLNNLYDHKFIEADVDGKYIKVAYPSYNLINKKYGIMNNIYLSGMWAGSTDILNNDIRSIIQASQLMANNFMAKLSD